MQPDSRSKQVGLAGVLPQGSVYLTLDHWAYGYIDVLIARGTLKNLSPLIQPYRRIDVARALREAEAERELTLAEEEWLELLEREFQQELILLAEGSNDFRFSAELIGGMKALTHTHRDPLRPEGDESLFVTGEIAFYGEAPALAAALWGRWDNHYLNDPQFPNQRAIEFRACDPVFDVCAYRIEEAYAELQLPYARLFFGRMYRNWGLPGNDGLQLSSYSYSYDHIGYRFGSERISMTGLFTPFNDFPGDTARYFSAHRFDWMIRDNLMVTLGESVVYGGENRRIDFSLTNPFGIWEISGSSGNNERNSLGFFELWWRPFSALVTYGALLIDNTSVGDEDVGKTSGLNQYAVAGGVQLPGLTPSVGLRLDFNVVSALAYRSRVAFYEYYTFDNLGLSRDVTDAIILDLEADWFARRGLVLKPGLEIMWRGEDDLRDPFPEDAFTGRDPLLVGLVETTVRPVIGGRWTYPRSDMPWKGLTLDLRWDLGLNFVKNKDNQPADWDAEAVGSIVLDIRQAF